MGHITKKLDTLLDDVEQGNLLLPELQRDFVWKRKQVELLFNSLYRELPIGHMVVWEARGSNVHTKAFEKQDKPHKRQSYSSIQYLLDGQQRLTTIKLVRDGDERFPLFFSLGSEQFRYCRNGKSNSDEIQVADVLAKDFEFEPTLDKYASTQEKREPFLKRLHKLRKMLDLSIGIIVFESDSLQDAMELFIRLNSGGKPLRKSDLAQAELAKRAPGLLRGGIEVAQRSWRGKGFPFTTPFLVECLAVIATGKTWAKAPTHEIKTFWRQLDEKTFLEEWENTHRGISKTITLLTGCVRWNSSDWITSFSALLPLIYICAKNKGRDRDDELARCWLLLASVRGYFSGDRQTRLDDAFKALKDNPTFKRLWEHTRKHKRMKKLEAKDFEVRQSNGPLMALYISFLRNHNARDWSNNTPLDGTVKGHNADLQVHHFFPKSLLRKHRFEPSCINTFANYAILSKDANLDVGSEEPAAYFSRLNVSTDDLHAQCIPQEEQLWRVDQYSSFIEARRELLAKQCNEFLGL